MTCPVSLFVAGRPAPQGSKRHVGRGILVESSKALAPWRSVVAVTVAEHITTPMTGPVEMILAFVMPRPRSTPKRSTPPAIKKPDLDKLTRAIFDAITSVAFIDDSQVVNLVASKRLAELGEVPGVHITLEEVHT